MYAEGGKLIIDKGYFEFKKFWKAIRRHICDDRRLSSSTSASLRQARWTRTTAIPSSSTMAWSYYNGIISDLNDGVDKCDTLRMAEILKHLPLDFMNNDSIMKLVELAIGISNKFVFMDSTDAVKFINEDAGIEVDGVWYSNGSFRYDRYFSSTSSSTRERYDYSWEREGYSLGPQYSKESGYRYAPHTQSINPFAHFDKPSGGGGGRDREAGGRRQRGLGVGAGHEVTAELDPDMPPSALFQAGAEARRVHRGRIRRRNGPDSQILRSSSGTRWTTMKPWPAPNVAIG
ncbi:MAG: hypothetical protein MZV49_24125 [Rhodopseudomonas palustris]|nr:hypothetical protein [Rhodopseudomonas palustris]